MNLKIYFQSLWTYVFKVYETKLHKLQVDDLKIHLKFADLNDTPCWSSTAFYSIIGDDSN